MKHYFKLFIALITLTSLVSCNDKKTRETQYMPDMYRSIPYKTDGDRGLNGKHLSLKPVAGTIAKGKPAEYDLPNTNEGYEYAKANLKSPLAKTEENLKNGEKMYNIYCISCHGKKGDGKGYLATSEKFVGIPNYKDRDITPGSIYHVLIHGKNLMGSHSSQLTYKERWQIIQHVEKLREALLK